MRPTLYLLAAVGLASCSDAGFDAVSISPIYGWVDGCTAVKVSGHGFGTDVDATIGGAPLQDVTRPDPASQDRTEKLDVGYLFYGVTPPSPSGAKGFADVVVTTGGRSSTIADGFYYVACPSAGPYPESLSPSTGVAAGTTVSLAGCKLDADSVRVAITGTGITEDDSAVVPLSSTCSTAEVSFTAPDLADGDYLVTLVDADGNELWPACTADTGADSADTGPGCPEPFTLTYGGAR